MSFSETIESTSAKIAQLVQYVGMAGGEKSTSQHTVNPIQPVDCSKSAYLDSGAKVIDGLYIGSLSTATSEYCLSQNKIDVIINLSGADYVTSRPLHKIVMDDLDVTSSTIESYAKKFAEGVNAIAAARMRGNNVLVHCVAGINRSAALIGFYLIQNGWTYSEALAALEVANESRNSPLLTNRSFRHLLQTRDAFRRHFREKISEIDNL